MTGYTRQSIAEIAIDEEVSAEPLNAEFNALADAFNSSSGHAHDGTSGSGPRISLSSSVTGNLPATNIANNSIPYVKLENITNNKVLGNVSGSTASISPVDILDEDNMVSNRSDALPTQQSVKAYVDALDAAVVDALDTLTDVINIELDEIEDEIDTLNEEIVDIKDRIETLETEIENVSTSDIVYESVSGTLASTTTLDIVDIASIYREFQIEVEAIGLISNPGTVRLLLSVGSSTTWTEFSTTNQELVVWSNSGMSARRLYATVVGLDDTSLGIVLQSVTSDNDFYRGIIAPSTYSTRPITKLRFRVSSSGSPVTMSYSKIRIRGIRK